MILKLQGKSSRQLLKLQVLPADSDSEIRMPTHPRNSDADVYRSEVACKI
jgi:hypothetical protein